jgi:hypothetical protein
MVIEESGEYEPRIKRIKSGFLSALSVAQSFLRRIDG